MAALRDRRFVVDANVLIDYAKTELRVLELTARHLGTVVILDPVLGEVEQLDRAQCERLGFEHMLPETSLLLQAASKRGPLSFQDHLCLLVARELGAVCVTNEKALRAACGAEGVSVLWGLELMIELAHLGHLANDEAIGIASAIHRTNPFITKQILERLKDRVSAISRS